MRRAAGSLAAAVVALGAAAPAIAREAASRDRAAVAAYHGLAAWVDIFDPGPWERPERAVRRWGRRGVSTLFVQTSNFRHRRPVHRPAMLARMLSAARRGNMRVIAWYLPGFDDPQRDWRRVKAAIGYVSPAGHRFDGFALDIEATAVRSIAVRNRRMLRLSSRLRDLVENRYAVGAIVPDPLAQRYWPRFPWRAVRERFDVVLPMCYWTHQIAGEARVYRHVRDALRSIRDRTGDPSVPVHVIGGIASHASLGEVGGFARAAVDFGAAGASLYDAPITRPRQWRRMARVGRLKADASTSVRRQRR